MGETGNATELECGASPLVGDGKGLEEVARRPRSVPSVEAGRGATGTANTEAAKESRTYVLAGRAELGLREVT